LADVDLAQLRAVKPPTGIWDAIGQTLVELMVVGAVVWAAVALLGQWNIKVPGETWWWVAGVPVSLNVAYLVLRIYKAFFRLMWIANVSVHFTSRDYRRIWAALAFPQPDHTDSAATYFSNVASSPGLPFETQMAATLLLGAILGQTSALESTIMRGVLNHAVRAYESDLRHRSYFRA
jgi:hypothetical protein